MMMMTRRRKRGRRRGDDDEEEEGKEEEEAEEEKETTAKSKWTMLHHLQFIQLLFLWIYVKGKANPLQAWTGPEGSRRLRLPDFNAVGT
jgi:hypothetical protein